MLTFMESSIGGGAADAARRRAPRGAPLEIAAIYMDMGGVLEAQGLVGEAASLFNRALAIWKRAEAAAGGGGGAAGGWDRELLHAGEDELVAIRERQRRRRRREELMAMHESTLGAVAAAQGEGCPEYAQTLEQMCALAEEGGDWGRAEQLAERLLALMRQAEADIEGTPIDMQTASRLREYTRRAERRVDNAKRQGKLRGGEGVGGAVGEEKGEGKEEEEEEQGGKEEQEEEEDEEAAAVVEEEEEEESAPEPVSADDAAALRITHFVRGVAARKKGLEYSRSFGDGPLGMMVDNLTVSFVADEGQAAALKVAVGSRLLSINGRRMDNDMDMVSAVQTIARPLEMWFTLVKKPDATNRYGMAWQLDGGFEKAGKKWKAKFLELVDDGTLSTRLKAKSKAREALQLAECCVEELKAEGEHESFVAQHTVGQFKKSSGPLFFFRVYDAAKEVAKAAAAEEDAREAREAVEAGAKPKTPKKKKKPARGAPPEELVLCLDDENEYKGWMAVLRRRALKESALPVVDVRARATSVNPMLAGKGGEG